MIWFLGILSLLGAAALAFGVWHVIGVCVIIWFAVLTTRVFNR